MEPPRKSPLSLNVLAQIQVIKILHKKAETLESEYIDAWSGRFVINVFLAWKFSYINVRFIFQRPQL